MKPVDLDRFRNIVDAYGAAPQRWPTDERASAEALLASSAEARRLRDEAAMLDRQLDMVPAWRPGPELRDRILAAAAAEDMTAAAAGNNNPRVVDFRARRTRSAGGGPVRLMSAGWQAASGFALAASLVLGLATGSLVSVGYPDAAPDILSAAQFADSYDGF